MSKARNEWTGYDKAIVRDVCYNCDSPVSKRSASYIDFQYHRIPKEKIMTECYGQAAFYFATVGTGHGRLIEIAVRREYKGRGMGRKVLMRLLSRLKAKGIYRLTFRTPIAEPAQDFWVHMGARIVGLKDDDYVMELNFK